MYEYDRRRIHQHGVYFAYETSSYNDCSQTAILESHACVSLSSSDTGEKHCCATAANSRGIPKPLHKPRFGELMHAD